MDFCFMFDTFKLIIFGVTLFIQHIQASNIGDPDTLSIVISTNSQTLQDFIQILDPPKNLHGKALTVEYRCTKDRIVGIEILADIENFKSQRLFSKVWKCKANTDSVPKKKSVRLKLPEEYKYNYNYFNQIVKFASRTKLRAWILDKELWSLRSGFARALAKVSYDSLILPPFSRPYVYVPVKCRKWSWDILRAISSGRIPTCPVEQETIEVIQYPVALNGLPYGVYRAFPRYADEELEYQRQRLLSTPRFTVSLWLYILEYCPGPAVSGRFCSIMFHMSQKSEYLTPLLFLRPDGRFHVQATQTDGQYSAGVTHIIAPKNQWFRLVFTFDNRSWKIRINYGKEFNEAMETDFTNHGRIYMDDTEGFLIFGGAESANSFKGYIGQATFYRGQIVDSKKIPLPSSYHPMFELKLIKRDEQCQTFLDWIDYKEQVFKQYWHRNILKRSCANTLLSFLGHRQVLQRRNVCDVNRQRRSKLWTIANSMIKILVRKGMSVSKGISSLIGDRLFANATAAIDSGIENISQVFPLLKQAACCGNLDAMFTVAVILNNGIFRKADEIQAHAYLMKAALEGHRLSCLALGHKHRYGIDGVPLDVETTFAYHKYVADTTINDKELHKDTDVYTESVRLTDEAAIKEQTDEDGDLFNWIKHQAKQGVLSAQNHAGRALYWGSQGLKRNLEAAIEYFRMGAETEDPQSMYDYGVVLLRGQGMQQNVEEGLKQLRKSAQKQNPSALNALGWYAMNHERNYTAAAEYFEQAYAGGNPDAAFHLGMMHLYGTYPRMRRDADRALDLFATAASHGQIDAGVAFANLMMLGTPGTKRDPYLATEWARYIAEKNPTIGYILRKAIQAYRREQSDVSLFYYFMAAEAGLEVGSFNVAWLCEENKNGVTSFIEKDCQWRHYNLSTNREIQFVDPYALIKMGDYYWYGCSGEKDPLKAANYYAEAARKEDPQALFNLGFIIEEGARIPRATLDIVPIPAKYQKNNVTMLEYLYTKCKESHQSEAFLPCRIALWRVQMVEFWRRYQRWLEVCGFAGIAALTVLSMYLFGFTHLRRQNNDLTNTI